MALGARRRSRGVGPRLSRCPPRRLAASSRRTAPSAVRGGGGAAGAVKIFLCALAALSQRLPAPVLLSSFSGRPASPRCSRMAASAWTTSTLLMAQQAATIATVSALIASYNETMFWSLAEHGVCVLTCLSRPHCRLHQRSFRHQRGREKNHSMYFLGAAGATRPRDIAMQVCTTLASTRSRLGESLLLFLLLARGLPFVARACRHSLLVVSFTPTTTHATCSTGMGGDEYHVYRFCFLASAACLDSQRASLGGRRGNAVSLRHDSAAIRFGVTPGRLWRFMDRSIPFSTARGSCAALRGRLVADALTLRKIGNILTHPWVVAFVGFLKRSPLCATGVWLSRSGRLHHPGSCPSRSPP